MNLKLHVNSWIGISILTIITIAVVTYFFVTSASIVDSQMNMQNVQVAQQKSAEVASLTIEKQMAVIKTSAGDIEIELLADKAPETVQNFIELSKSKFYDNTKFHRVIKNFMIQGGDPLSKGDDPRLYGSGGPGYSFDDEPNDVKLVRGVIAMANHGPNTNGSQFFIITAAETPWLQGKHTAFAKVVSGMDIVDKISNVRTNENDAPIEPIVVSEIVID